MKSLLFLVMTFIAFDGVNASDHEPAAESETKNAAFGSIVMEDSIMLLVTSDDGIISGVTVETVNAQTVVYTAGGCGGASCSYNLSSLTRDTYTVHVTTSTGGSFSGTVVAGS